jgi:uncharacterized membrane protein YfcA
MIGLDAVDPWLLLILFGVALVAATLDAIAGGGGLLTVPALLLAGLDPATALGTNKLQGAAGSLSSTWAFARKGLIDWTIAWPWALSSGAASVLGALCAKLLPVSVLQAAIPIVLVAIAVYFASARRMGDDDARARVTPLVFTLTLIPVVGFYDGLFGPGAGSFYLIGFVTLLGFGVTRATAHTKLANAASNVGSLGLFALTGSVNLTIGLVMALGAFLGAQIGSRLAMRLGARLIRPLLVVMACLMAIRLLADPANPLRVAIAALF